ncbi:Hsp20/alpha crystallin family protein [Paenibacillus dakarensis]|uniref:Hsp20/alpha crystallin family protein n=1 Tax=Paenibacillus dakarensis TaxID=1527293 RepID=UPI0006D55C9F|nr:Hsp20/alpha crystallin family protein [Paenibacillus dakarensis]
MKWFPAAKKEHQLSSNWPSLFDWDDFDIFSRRGNQLFSSDIKETDKEYELSVDLPGYDKKQIEIDYHNDMLTIKASREEEQDEKDDEGSYIRRERISGSCVRQYHLPNVNEEEIEAKFDNGVLKIEMPKLTPTESDKRRIEIK